MSMISFIRDPFPDNHNGFDYSPKSFTDVQREHDEAVSAAESAKAENKLMSLIASIFK